MRVVETVGRTIDEAVRDALKQLGVGRDDVEIEIVEEGSKGLFGLLGGRRARVRVQLKPGVEPGFMVDDIEFEQEGALEPQLAPDLTDFGTVLDRAGQSGESDPIEDVRHERVPTRKLSAADERVIEQKLEEARQFVAGIVERLGVEAAFETRRDEDGIVHVHIVGDELGLIIGRRGQTLDALQFLVNQAANKDGGPRARIVLDAGGYRARRAEALEALAGRMADKAVRQGRKVALDPMNAFERRIVHMSLADDDAVETYSEGEDPHRRIIIAPKG